MKNYSPSNKFLTALFFETGSPRREKPSQLLDFFFTIQFQKNSEIEWKYSRSRMWLEWIDKGNMVPAPINMVYYTLYGSILFADKVCCCRDNGVRKRRSFIFCRSLGGY